MDVYIYSRIEHAISLTLASSSRFSFLLNLQPYSHRNIPPITRTFANSNHFSYPSRLFSLDNSNFFKAKYQQQRYRKLPKKLWWWRCLGRTKVPKDKRIKKCAGGLEGVRDFRTNSEDYDNGWRWTKGEAETNRHSQLFSLKCCYLSF